jgi:hypothetical protein
MGFNGILQQVLISYIAQDHRMTLIRKRTFAAGQIEADHFGAGILKMLCHQLPKIAVSACH